jgi:hypothetical protein
LKRANPLTCISDQKAGRRARRRRKLAFAALGRSTIEPLLQADGGEHPFTAPQEDEKSGPIQRFSSW